MCLFISYHQTSSCYGRVDGTSVLFQAVYPDSEIARKFWSAQTKTKGSSVIASHAIESVMQVFKNSTESYCGVATDASTYNAVKVFPVVIQCFDWKNGGLHSKSIEVHQQSNAAAETIVQYIKGILEKHFFKSVEYLGFWLFVISRSFFIFYW